MPRPLPPRPNLHHLRAQARDLLRAARAGDLQARERVAAARLAPPDPLEPLRLAVALTVVAREYGFPSWPKLRQHLAAIRTEVVAGVQSPRVRSRRQAAAQRRAAEVTAAAEQSDLDTLLRVIFAPAWEMNAARALLAAQPVYERVIALLLAGLDDPRPDVRFLAVQALDHVADQRCAPALRRRLDDPVPRVRWAAIHALTCAACKVAPFAADADLVPILVERALVDPSIRVRRVAAASLGAVCHDTRALTALETLAARETDAVLLRNVRWALRQRQKRRPA